jgi:methionyl-tRNA synthetase
MDEPRKFYLTTPIYYANSRPHVGSAYTTIVCDVVARYKRMCGYDVAYLTGTDEHGVNIERAAERQGISPADLVDRNQKIFLELWKLLDIGYTHFMRTTSTEHAIAVQKLVRRTLRRTPDAIYKARYEGRYCIHDNLYVSDSPEPADCPICGRPAELISEENYFFRLSTYQEKLLQLYRDQPDFVRPDFRMNEVKSFVESGLKDISISRKSIKWGIPWPDDPEHVFYVWYDALTTYLSGIGFAEGEKGSAEFQKFWPADVHMIGKEIIRFHAVYWPAFLMAAELPLPKQIFAHGWLLFEQEKMSKSKGNVAYSEPIVNVLGNDALRYYLLRETVFGQDGNFSREALITRYNADLANGLGNLASRTLTMINQFSDGVVACSDDPRAQSSLAPELVRRFEQIYPEALKCYNSFEFFKSLELIWSLVAQIDIFLTESEPWILGSDRARWPDGWHPSERWLSRWGADRPAIPNQTRQRALQQMLYVAAESVRTICVLAHPVIPDATQKIWEQLGQQGKLGNVRIDQLKWGDLKSGTRIGKPEGVFPRVDKTEASERIEAMEQEIRSPASPAPAAPTAAATTGAAPVAAPAANAKIGMEDFAKVEMRVGIVKSAEKVAGADKLLKVLVDIGDEVRQIVAGIALAYTPEELVGRKVAIVTNLAPRKLRGVESNGMILAASAGPEGKPVLCTFTEDVPPGAKIK